MASIKYCKEKKILFSSQMQAFIYLFILTSQIRFFPDIFENLEVLKDFLILS